MKLRNEGCKTFCFFLSFYAKAVIFSSAEDADKDDDEPLVRFDNINTTDVIKSMGYEAESHFITTKDGYVLEMHRIPHNKKKDVKINCPPVLLQHGFLCSSLSFMQNDSENALPFLLSNEGYDVWLGNVRGSGYSKNHVNLTTSDSKFWDFSWHETALYDVTRQIDYILEKTNCNKLNYVGHSMGTTMLFVLTSLLSEYNEKIMAAFLMSPVSYMRHVGKTFLRLLTPLANLYYLADKLLLSGEFPPKGPLGEALVYFACNLNPLDRRLCDPIYLKKGNYTDHLKKLITKPVPRNSFSVKGLTHFAQLINSGEFRQFNYGCLLNFYYYGCLYPPEYGLEKIRVPTYFYVSHNDRMATIGDAKLAASRLSSLQCMHIVNETKFNHLDFLLSNSAKTQVYDYLINDMMNHPRCDDLKTEINTHKYKNWCFW